MSEGIIKQGDDGVFRSNVKDHKEIMPLRLSPKDWEMIEKAKIILEQPKDSTAIKQLARIGYIVLHDKKVSGVLKVLFENKRRNKRTGIVEYLA